MKCNSLKKSVLKILILAFVVLAMPACISKRKLIREPIKEEGAEFLFRKLKENEVQFDFLSAKFQAKLEVDKKSNSFTGNLRMQRDSAIWISISPALGIELFRVLITPDSVCMLNRVDRTYFCGSFDLINQMMQTEIDFDMLQSVIIGNDFSYYENDVFKADVDNQMYRLSTLNRVKIKRYVRHESQFNMMLSQDIWLDIESFRIRKMMVKVHQKENRKLEIEFSKHQLLDKFLFPFEQYYSISAEKQTSISLSFDRVQQETALSFPFSVPPKYSLMSFEE